MSDIALIHIALHESEGYQRRGRKLAVRGEWLDADLALDKAIDRLHEAQMLIVRTHLEEYRNERKSETD